MSLLDHDLDIARGFVRADVMLLGAGLAQEGRLAGGEPGDAEQHEHDRLCPVGLVVDHAQAVLQEHARETDGGDKDQRSPAR